MDRKNVVNGISAPAKTTSIGGDEVGDGFDLLTRVGSSYGKTTLTHDREVNNVVAHISKLIEGISRLREDLVYGVHLMRLTLVDELKFEVIGSNGYRLRLALCDDADTQSAKAAKRYSKSIVRGKTFCLDSVTL